MPPKGADGIANRVDLNQNKSAQPVENLRLNVNVQKKLLILYKSLNYLPLIIQIHTVNLLL